MADAREEEARHRVLVMAITVKSALAHSRIHLELVRGEGQTSSPITAMNWRSFDDALAAADIAVLVCVCLCLCLVVVVVVVVVVVGGE